MPWGLEAGRGLGLGGSRFEFPAGTKILINSADLFDFMLDHISIYLVCSGA